MEELLGIGAGIFVILAFYTRKPKRLRIYALASNLLFVTYGCLLLLWPVVILHVLLLVLNGARMVEIMRARSPSGDAPPDPLTG